ncbi:MAG: double-strand break repair protein AddB [Sphingobium sp.]|nr:double-strand break repair protein AddB [Sphingobium sp.]MCP5398831.1 double-strand break repair protein AddB [Sphingomonas sp.]
MAERERPAVFTIPAHRAFSDALASGIIAQHGKDALGLARGIVLLPNNRAVRAVSSAFVRQSGGGLLMPRLVPIGDENLGERLGNALDPIGEGADVPPAIPPMQRQMILARLVQETRGAKGQPVDAGEAMRLGQALGQAIDQMLIEKVSPQKLRDMEGQVTGELSDHWRSSLQLLELLLARWPDELAKLGMIDMADRRNRLLEYVARRWRDMPPGGFVIAAGIATSAPAITAVLRTISRMERGQVVLAELDQHMSTDEWESIGPFEPDPVSGFRARAQESHPQYLLKSMLNGIGVAREEVALWRWGGGHDARAARSRNISNAMLPPVHTGKWRTLVAAERTLNGVRTLELATPAQEAQAVALMLREAVEEPERTAALVTPDRDLATRVSAHLERWGINADDSAGQALHLTPPGTLLLAIARVVADDFAPVALLDLLKHPLVRKSEGRLDWLEEVRGLDLLLRGPRPAPGLAGVDVLLSPRPRGEEDRQSELRAKVALWWKDAQSLLEPLAALKDGAQSLSPLLAQFRDTASMLSDDQIWAGHQGRALADLYGEMESAAVMGPQDVDIRAMPDMLRRLMEPVAVRPPQGGHPRIAIYGLLEARLQQADLMVLSGLNEGTWPGLPAPDPWLAPRIRQELGLPGLEQRIGLAAHDFASALGAPRVVITRSRRSANAPAIASRFWLRLQAIAGDNLKQASEYAHLADTIDRPEKHEPSKRPQPRPPLSLRPEKVAVTQVDRLAADPYAFYARHILKLQPLDLIDADPGPAWRGTHVHKILELWFREDDCAPDKLEGRARAFFRRSEVHPVLRALWLPRLLASFRWISEQVTSDMAAGRHIELVETEGASDIAGIRVSGTADRIDTMPDGSIAIVDYKTGKPPSAAQVKAGFALQLGLLGAIAERGGFPDLKGTKSASKFEYWSTGKDRQAFGYRKEPTKAGGSDKIVATEELTSHAVAHFTQAADKWLTGAAPFTAQLNPDLPSYGEYDQLMRLEEWYGRGDSDG